MLSTVSITGAVVGAVLPIFRNKCAKRMPPGRVLRGRSVRLQRPSDNFNKLLGDERSDWEPLGPLRTEKPVSSVEGNGLRIKLWIIELKSLVTY